MPKRDPTIEHLKEHAWQEVTAINQALEEGRIDDEGWHEAIGRIEYLQAISKPGNWQVRNSIMC